MKRTAIAVAIAALGLAACGTPTIVVNPTAPVSAATSATPAPAPPSPAPAVGDDHSTAETQLLNFLDDRGLGYSDPGDVLEAANGVCDFLDEGGTASELLAIAVDNSGDDPELIATVTAGAVVFICPRHEAALDAALDGAL